jgi:hypothetical protein
MISMGVSPRTELSNSATGVRFTGSPIVLLSGM